MKKTAQILLLAATGFEDIELITSVDVFNRAGFEVTIVSPEDKELVKGKYVAQVASQKMSSIDRWDQFDALVIPGGPGHAVLLKNAKVLSLIKRFNAAQKLIGAICAAPQLLVKAEIVQERPITAYPGYGLTKTNKKTALEVADNLITARDFEQSLSFAQAIVEALGGQIEV
ncbi:protein dj-1beta-like [Centruroides sculpturatus]|uniref:protein dj-1beta-like n=1 Tax=Centruroides sculpturatus TaxID=218467 RepID=UPI000C6EBBBF|nr:protein dj-1beta-like [Centruroides sculpturatus]